MKKAKEIVYERIIDKYKVEELRNAGLSDNGIINFADNIMDRYFCVEYLDQENINLFNERR